MSLRVIKIQAKYLAIDFDAGRDEWQLVASRPLDANSLAKLLAERGWHQVDIWTAFGIADPEQFPSVTIE